jgi:phosphomannomutase
LQTQWLNPVRMGPSAGDSLRAMPPETIAGRAVVTVTDLLTGERRERDGGFEAIDLPASDVLIYALEDDSRVIVRPSGTEPKLKCYYEVHDQIGAGESFAAADHRSQATLDELAGGHQAELAALWS